MLLTSLDSESVVLGFLRYLYFGTAVGYVTISFEHTNITTLQRFCVCVCVWFCDIANKNYYSG